ncbi:MULTISPECIES: hypothetical protein [Sporomusa]|uniref:hypothetical protein n=1 Tax=Sporomusa TaxID=2375 RepID=UPI0016691C63|nr:MULTISPECIES: hypothetical protein [Sporomusa]HML33582.1 hypothetical protein [Sporomusa sphaeroides]
MQTGQVGQLYEYGQDKLEEKIVYRLDRDGHGLVIIEAGIAAREVESIAYGSVELGLYIDGPIIFLLFKFGTSSWNDAPYSWHTVPRDLRAYPVEVADADILKVTLVDAEDGLIRAVRKVALAPAFADALNAAITVQANGSFNGLSYAKHINSVYNQYTAEDMADLAAMHMVS